MRGAALLQSRQGEMHLLPGVLEVDSYQHQHCISTVLMQGTIRSSLGGRVGFLFTDAHLYIVSSQD